MSISCRQLCSVSSIPMLADGDRVCGGNVGDDVVGSSRVVGAVVGFFVGRSVGKGVVVH